MRAALAFILGLVGVVLVPPALAGPASTPSVTAGAGNDDMWADAKQDGTAGTSANSGASDSSPVATGTLPPGHYESQPVCAKGGAQTCATEASCSDGTSMKWVWYQTDDGRQIGRALNCPGASSSNSPSAPSAISPYEALAKVVLPEAVLHFQPVGNQTLVHFKSNYYTDGEPFDAAVDLPVGPVTFHVDFKIAPTEFDWTFGDGTMLKTSTPGAPYPKLLVTHEYAKAGTVQAHVDTVYGAQYRVNGGAWAPVDGTVTKHGADVTITVRQATPVLTD